MSDISDNQAGQARAVTGRDFVPGSPYVRPDAGLVTVTAKRPAVERGGGKDPSHPREIVLDTLAHHHPLEMGRKQIIKATGLGAKQVANALYILRVAGKAEHGPKGGWRIAGRDDGIQSVRATAKEIVERGAKAVATDSRPMTAEEIESMPEIIDRAGGAVAEFERSLDAPESLSVEMTAELQKLRTALRGHSVPALGTKLQALDDLAEALGGELGQLLREIRGDLLRLTQ